MSRKSGLSSQISGAVVSAAILLAVSMSMPAFAGDVTKEVSTAAEHAGYAADATLITTAYSHLHHTINCLVGPLSASFDAKEANPCAAMGSGAIPDTTDATKAKNLKAALKKAKAGLASKDLATAKTNAAAAQALLKKAM